MAIRPMSGIRGGPSREMNRGTGSEALRGRSGQGTTGRGPGSDPGQPDNWSRIQEWPHFVDCPTQLSVPWICQLKFSFMTNTSEKYERT